VGLWKDVLVAKDSYRVGGDCLREVWKSGRGLFQGGGMI